MGHWQLRTDLSCPKCHTLGKLYLWEPWPDFNNNSHCCGGCQQQWTDDNARKGGKSMLTELKSAAQKFLQDNRDMIFSVLLLFIVDTYFLNGALRNRLESLLHKTVDKLEKPDAVKA